MALAPQLASFERELRDAIVPSELQRHLEVFNSLQRLDGTEDERRSVDYIAEQMHEAGVQCDVLEYETFVSRPGPGRLEVVAPERFELPTRTRAFSPSTPPGGLEAEVVWVGSGSQNRGGMIFTHAGREEDFKGVDLRGKAVLTTGGRPDGVMYAQQAGAVALVDVWPSDEDVLHEMTVSSIWGTPTPESASRLVRIPVMTVRHRDGQRLRQMLEQGPVRIKLEAEVFTGPERITQPVATIPGSVEADRFLLVGAHIDSWYEGVTDNATGDVALIEMARVLSNYRNELRRGVRFCWWPGHSTGRYSGSTWYTDTRFRELRDHCVGYLNIDSPGVRETEIWDCRYNMGEIEHLTAAVVQELSGQQPNIRRPLRAGDQSFLGVGLPSLGAYRMLAVDHPDRKAVGGCGGAYWWHSPEDTLDKADAAILADDTRIYATMAARLVLPALHPYDFGPSARDFVEHLTALQDAAGEHLDLGELIAEAERLRAGAARLAALAEGPLDEGQVERLNAGMLALSRLLNPALFTIDGPYEFDPALQLPLLPGLAPLSELAALDPRSSEYRFLLTRLRRQRNRVHDALLQATRLVERLVNAGR